MWTITLKQNIVKETIFSCKCLCALDNYGFWERDSTQEEQIILQLIKAV